VCVHTRRAKVPLSLVWKGPASGSDPAVSPTPPRRDPPTHPFPLSRPLRRRRTAARGRWGGPAPVPPTTIGTRASLPKGSALKGSRTLRGHCIFLFSTGPLIHSSCHRAANKVDPPGGGNRAFTCVPSTLHRLHGRCPPPSPQGIGRPTTRRCAHVIERPFPQAAAAVPLPSSSSSSLARDPWRSAAGVLFWGLHFDSYVCLYTYFGFIFQMER